MWCILLFVWGASVCRPGNLGTGRDCTLEYSVLPLLDQFVSTHLLENGLKSATMELFNGTEILFNLRISLLFAVSYCFINKG